MLDPPLVSKAEPRTRRLERCQRWINAISRENFTIKNVTRNTYVCALHWPDGKGLTEELPEFTETQIRKASRSKRKAPKQSTTGLPDSVFVDWVTCGILRFGLSDFKSLDIHSV